MTRDEAIVIKCYDSEKDGRARFSLVDYAGATIAFTHVLDFAGSGYLEDATYYLGRSEKATGNLAAALMWFKEVVSKYPGGTYEDNAFYHEVQIYVDQADCPSANTVVTDLQTRFPGGMYTVMAQDYAVMGGC